MLSGWTSSRILTWRRKENKTKMTKSMRLSVSNRQKWGSTGTLQVHADLQFKCLLLRVGSAWSLTSLTAAGERWAGDVLRAACVHNDAWSWRPFTGAFVAEGLGERRERETDMA